MENEELLVASKDFHKLESSHLKSGYREGSSKGHQLSLQQSFEIGFTDGIKKNILLGQLLGCLNALKVDYEKDNRNVDEITRLITETENCKEAENSKKDDVTKYDADNASPTSTVQHVIQSIEPSHTISEIFHKYKSLLK